MLSPMTRDMSVGGKIWTSSPALSWTTREREEERKDGEKGGRGSYLIGYFPA